MSSEIKQGSVVVQLPIHIELLPQAGKLSAEEMRASEKARRGVGLACEQTAEAMRKNPERFQVVGISPDSLQSYGRQAEDIDSVIVDLETVLGILKQNNTLLDARAHQSLRRVLAYVRSMEKFDPKLAALVPHLIAYFAKRGQAAEAAESED
jgi:hypothetical protein